MIKLSELPMETLLCVEQPDGCGFDLMSKELFLKYMRKNKRRALSRSVYIADRNIFDFDLYCVIDNLVDEANDEGLVDDIYEAVKDLPQTNEFLKIMQKEFAEHPDFSEGEYVLVDVENLGGQNHGL